MLRKELQVALGETPQLAPIHDVGNFPHAQAAVHGGSDEVVFKGECRRRSS